MTNAGRKAAIRKRMAAWPWARKAVTAAAVALSAAAPLACGSAATSAVTAGVTAGTGTSPPPAANPVPIVTAAGATPDPGEVVGSIDIWGDRYASGSYPGGEQVTVYTFATATAQAAGLARDGTPTDTHAVIQGHLANVYVTPVGALSGGWAYAVTPAQIASRVNGKLVGQ